MCLLKYHQLVQRQLKTIFLEWIIIVEVDVNHIVNLERSANRERSFLAIQDCGAQDAIFCGALGRHRNGA